MISYVILHKLEMLPDRPLNPDPMTRAGTKDLIRVYEVLKRGNPPPVRRVIDPHRVIMIIDPPHRNPRNPR